jgi:hypothetical protein
MKGEVMKWADGGLVTLHLEEETKVVVEKTRYICAGCILMSFNTGCHTHDS